MEALALKYRPKNFEALIGQEAVSKSLTHALKEGRISHAYLFSGLRGSGKTSSARIFSKSLVCEHGPTPTPCETCPHCIMANENRHIDIIEMDAASHRKIDDIRDLIEQTRYAPSAARFKIFIIDEVHMLTKEAFNALLKTLEEPPSYVKFILATTDPLKLPATVLSRTQHYRFKQIPRYAILKHLEFILKNENIQYELPALETLSRSGGGSLRDTLTLLDQAIIYSAQNTISQQSVASMLGLLDPLKIEHILDIVATRDKDGVSNLVKELDGIDAEMMIDEIIANLKDKFLNADPKFSLLVYERFFRILSQTKGMLAINNDTGFVIMLMLFMMIEAMSLKEIDNIIQNKQTHKVQIRQEQQETKQIQLAPKIEAAPKTPYEQLLERIYDRDYNLGQAFETCIKFISFENGTMKLQSNASGQNQAKLRDGSKVIITLLRQLFGANASIQIEQNKQEIAQNIDTSKEQILNQDTQKQEQEVLEYERPKLVQAVSRDDTNDFIIAYDMNKPQAHKALHDEEQYFDELEDIEADLARLETNEQEKSRQDQVDTMANFASLMAPKTQEEAEQRRQDLALDELKRLFGEPSKES